MWELLPSLPRVVAMIILGKKSDARTKSAQLPGA